MADSSEIDAALVGRLLADAPLAALLPDGVFIDLANAGAQRFVIVSLVSEADAPTFDQPRAFEDAVYMVKAVALSSTGANIRDAAKRIDDLLDGGPLTIPGYQLMTLHRESRFRAVEADEGDKTIRWEHRGGNYRLMAYVTPAP